MDHERQFYNLEALSSERKAGFLADPFDDLRRLFDVDQKEAISTVGGSRCED